VIFGNGARWHPGGVRRWLREVGIWNQRPVDKRVPQAAFRLAGDQVASLLRHLWATDATIWCGTRRGGRPDARVTFSTASQGLAADVAALLLRLGIVARTTIHIRATGTRLHGVTVSGASDQRRFLELVGDFGATGRQADSLRTMLADVHPTPNVDTLPIQTWQGIRAGMTARAMSQRAGRTARRTAYGGTSRVRCARPPAVLADCATLPDDPELAATAGGDLFWDRVVAVEDAGEEQVFDLTVPGPACWLADGIVTHNSGQIEQDADLVAFIYRDEYYDKESERQGIADIVIAKHRNGALGDVELTFAKEYPKFLNYTSPERYG
jgi:replicative DNA helicase